MHETSPLVDVQRSELFVDFYYCTALDCGRRHVSLGPGVVSRHATVEKVESKRLNLHWDADGNLDCRFEAENHGARTRLHDLDLEELERRFIDDIL